jgi:hypothetical protein
LGKVQVFHQGWSQNYTSRRTLWISSFQFTTSLYLGCCCWKLGHTRMIDEFLPAFTIGAIRL